MKPIVVTTAAVVALAGCGEPTEPASNPSANILEVRCDGLTTEILTSIVQARGDGVHVLIHNVSDGEVLTQWESGGDGVGPGDSVQLLPVPPGDARFRCMTISDNVDPGAPGGWGSFTVLEPPGWVSTELDCPGGDMVAGNIDYVPGARGVGDPLLDTAERSKNGEVRQAGYATEDERTFVAFEDGVPTKSFTYVSDGKGGWLLSQTSACS